MYLDKLRPTFTLIYFVAGWNPVIPVVEKDYENTCNQFQSYTHIRVDCDKHPLIKQYFYARVEPSYLILLKGGELRRIIGYNFEKLHDFMTEASDL